jgi:hypothetical protein
MKHTYRRISALATALAAMALLAVAATPASADTWHHRWTYLHFPATGNHYFADRILTLNGTYHWTIFGQRWSAGPAERTRTVKLAGRYRMIDTLERYQVDGKWARGYRHYAALVNMTTGGRVAMGHVLNSLDGQYHWGSRIANVR